jgi:hypothetical protein
MHNLGVLVRIARVDHEVVVIRACHDILGVAGEGHLEFVKDAVVLVGVAKSRTEVLMDGNGLHGLSLHVDIPDLDGEVVSGKDVTTVVAEADVGDGRNDLGEE